MPIPTQDLETYTTQTYVIIQAVSEYAGYLNEERTEEDNAILSHLRAAVGALLAAIDVSMRPAMGILTPPVLPGNGASGAMHGPFSEFPHPLPQPQHNNTQPAATPPASPPRPAPRR
jgi:hypothetical protein